MIHNRFRTGTDQILSELFGSSPVQMDEPRLSPPPPHPCLSQRPRHALRSQENCQEPVRIHNRFRFRTDSINLPRWAWRAQGARRGRGARRARRARRGRVARRARAHGGAWWDGRWDNGNGTNGPAAARETMVLRGTMGKRPTDLRR